MSSNPEPELDEFAAAASRRRALAHQLAGQPLQEVVGVVDAHGTCGWPEDGDQWTLSFSLQCWKVPSGPLKTLPLSVELTTTRPLFDSLWEQLPSYAVVRIRARVVEESVVGSPQAQLTEFLGLDRSDAELNQAAVDLQKPVIYRDPQFGEFTLDRSLGWYSSETDWNGTAVSLNLEVDESGKLDPALQFARSLWKDQKEWAKRIEDYAVLELLPLKNASWLGDDEAELTPKQFKDRMSLESVTVSPDGSFDFWHHDGDLFWGHSIQIRGSLVEGPTLADIPG